MHEKQTILTITKIEPANKPATTILTFKEKHLARQHLKEYFIAEKKILAKLIGADPNTILLFPMEKTCHQRIISQQSGEQSFYILANHYHIAWLNIEAAYNVTNEEVQAVLDAFVNSNRSTAEYKAVAKNISATMHRYCQNELWKFIKALIEAFALGGHDVRNKTAANQALELQNVIENNNAF